MVNPPAGGPREATRGDIILALEDARRAADSLPQSRPLAIQAIRVNYVSFGVELTV